jgi:ankyrin repeat protein
VDITTFSSEVTEALRAGDSEELIRLLTHDPRQVYLADPSGYTLLHYAVMEENESLLRLLLDQKVQVDAKDSAGMTPLHHAAKNAQTRIAKTLAHHGANLEQEDDGGMTSLMWAAVSRSGKAGEIADTLIGLGASMSLFPAVLLNRTAEVENIIAFNPEAVRQSRFKSELLRTAILYQNLVVLALLIDHGLSPNEVLIGGLTPLAFACSCSIEGSIVEALLKRGADPNAQNVQDGSTALDIAEQCQRLDLVPLLKMFGAKG